MTQYTHKMLIIKKTWTIYVISIDITGIVESGTLKMELQFPLKYMKPLYSYTGINFPSFMEKVPINIVESSMITNSK